jgi:hypothetical protein
MHYPDGYKVLVETLWALPEPQARLFWNALVRSRLTRAVSFRQQIALLGRVRIDVPHFVEQACAPAAVIAVVESLVTEGQLRRSQASRLEEYILNQTDEHGCWRGNAWDGRERPSTLAPDVLRFADVGTH